VSRGSGNARRVVVGWGFIAVNTASSPAGEGQVLQCESTACGCGEGCDQTDHEGRLGSGRGMDSGSGELSNGASNPPLSSGAPELVIPQA
jgi:hypothetical protein